MGRMQGSGPIVTVDDIDLSDVEFWKRPWDERDAAFTLLRRERPIGHYAEPDLEPSVIEFPKGAGYYALTRYADVAEVSRRPDVFLSGHGYRYDVRPTARDGRVLLGHDLDRQSPARAPAPDRLERL